MSLVAAIDPGPIESAYAVIDRETCKPIAVGKVPNDELASWLRLHAHTFERVAIEMIASYGMGVGQEVFDTCVWIGHFERIALDARVVVTRIKRLVVKLHHCYSASATDANVSRALIDRFAYGKPNRGKGTKAEPGWFYGFAKDIWQAYALAVFVADAINEAAA